MGPRPSTKNPTPMMLTVRVALVLSCICPANSIDGRPLAAAGIVVTGDKAVNIYTSSQTGSIIVKLLPNLPKDKEACAKAPLDAYNRTLTTLLTPLGDSIRRIQESVTTSGGRRQKRFIGAIIGGVALGVATAAQITAAAALIQAKQNAANILRLKESIAATNEAVHEVTDGLSQLAVAVGKMQQFVNDQFNKTAQESGCIRIAQQVGVELNLYLTELTTVFGPQITSPALNKLTIQALYNLAGGNMDYLLTKLGVGNNQLSSLIGSGLITGNPILYDSQTQLLGIQVTLPSVGNLNNMRATYLETLSVSTTRGFASALVPKVVTQVGSVIEELDTSYCIETDLDLYCTRIVTFPMSPGIYSCLSGNTSACMYSKTEGALTTPYMTIKGSVIANCKMTTCRCVNPPGIISQNYGEAVSLIDKQSCNVLSLDGITLRLSGEFDATYQKNISIQDSQVIITGNLDISTELGNVNNSISNALNKLEESNSKLDKVNVKLTSTSALITYIVLTIISLVFGILSLVLACYLMYKQKAQQKTLLWLGNNTLDQMRATTKM
uniref:Fusion glycoprotein F0 n=11 Tax=Avian paramyxovirus 1 TaxID=2560319 RepID=FUS_NDVTG|nr:RecName: Full=Fusion glycoprotein F0; Contains: RecName: Full=Fusion glycoprotein F2; Contains: RecName: Full=Fusion glycoprotein F1; Flags: Precursor [Newcastle disease virus (STRAIN TEXAS G.B./48)]AAA46642.1 F envelope glycoprotein precursor [avian paramyxovirus 1]AAA46649.1 fusion protein [avian paramyxovirus 1]